MPYWYVSQPHLTLFVRDKPLFYNTGYGRQVAFELHFKNTPGLNGAVDTAQPGIFSVGTNWHTPWRSYVQWSSGLGRGVYFVFLGDGSARQYAVDNYERWSGSKLTGDEADGFTLWFPSGSVNRYGLAVTLGQQRYWFLTEKRDAQGHSLQFSYATDSGWVRLEQVRDHDGQEITFTYATGTYYAQLLTGIQGPYGLTVTLQYDDQDRLTNITDVLGLSTELRYDTAQRLAELVTPYGTNRFDYLSSEAGWSGLHVIELGLRHHLYLTGIQNPSLWPTAQTESMALAEYLRSCGFFESLETNGFADRNTVYWGPKQFDNLPAAVKASLLNGTFDAANLTTNDFQKGWTYHWLRAQTQNSNNVVLSSSLSVSRAPSPQPDGSTEGLLTFYDYEAKWEGDREMDGAQMRPWCEAWREPGGPWRVVYRTYTPAGLPLSVKDNYGSPATGVRWRQRQFQYAANGIDLIYEVLDGTVLTAYTYNNAHQVLTRDNALGERTSYEYTGTLLTRVTRPSGLITDYAYNQHGWLTQAVDRTATQFLRTNSFTYTNGYLWTHTDERGLTVTYLYDALGRLTHTLYPDGTGITNVYDRLHLVATYDRLGFTNGYAYNGFRELIRHTNANGHVTHYHYCSCGGLEGITDPLGQTTTFSLDPLGRRTRTTYPDNTWVDTTYDLQGRPIRHTDSAGVSTTNYYTIDGLLYCASNAFGQVFYRQVDAHGHIVVSTDANGVTTTNAYDALGRLTRRSQRFIELGPYDRWVVEDYLEYTPGVAGPTLSRRQYVEYWLDDQDWKDSGNYWPIEHQVQYQYDLFDRKTNEIHSAIDFWGDTVPVQTNSFAYNAAGDLIALTDGNRNTTRWEYDLYGRVIKKWDAAGNLIFQYVYDANGRLTNRWTPGQGGTGISTTYRYDPVGNLLQVDYPTSPDISLAYDAAGRLTNMVDGIGTTRYTYTASGALASEDGPWTSDTVSYAYDQSGRRRRSLTLAQPNASAWVQTYAYDAAGRLSQVASPAGTFDYTYHPGLDPDGLQSPTHLVQRLQLPGGAAITNAYDPWGRLLTTDLRDSAGGLLNHHSYQYNDLDQRISQARLDGSQVTYVYDALGQLVGASAQEANTTPRLHEQLRYQYDAAGNLIKRTNHALVQTFSVNNLNELTGVSRTGTFTVAGAVQGVATSVTVADNGNAPQAASLYADGTFARSGVNLLSGTNTFTAVATDALGRWDTNTVTAYLPATVSLAYDLNGNLRTNGTRILDYDDENQLIAVTEPGAWRSEFSYDGNLRRRVRREYVWRGGQWVLAGEVRYIYDGLLVVQERNGLNLPELTYTRGLDLSGTLDGAGGIGGLLACTYAKLLQAPGSMPHAYYACDGNGNVTCLVYPNGQVGARYLYDPFGNLLAAVGPLAEANLYRFSSKEWHRSSGLVYYGYRFYDPSLQRWVNRDPIAEKGGINLFAFVRQNPITASDPDGRALHAGPVILVGVGIGLGFACDLAGCQLRVWYALYDAEGEADRLAPDGSTHRGATAVEGGDADALTHCIAGCNLARNSFPCLGPDHALARLQAHEHERGDGTAEQLDRLNNEVGFGIGGSNLWQSKSCGTACLDALGRGLLYEIKNGRIVPSSIQ
jgi:RHS repeat-associated protein